MQCRRRYGLRASTPLSGRTCNDDTANCYAKSSNSSTTRPHAQKDTGMRELDKYVLCAATTANAAGRHPSDRSHAG